MSRRIASILGLAALLVTGTAFASAGPPPPRPLVHLRVAGEAVLRDVSVTVRCEDPDGEGHAARCRVSAGYELTAPGTAMLRAEDLGARRGEGAPDLRLDGEPFGGERTLSEGDVVRVTIEETRTLRAERREDYFFVAPNRVRHPLLGESSAPWRAPQPFGGALADGPRIRVEGPIHADVEPGPARVTIGAEDVRGIADLEVPRPTLQLTLPVEPPEDAWAPVRHGGPVLGLGSRVRFYLPNDEGRFLLRVGYELAFFDYLFASLWIETDFESVMEVALVEVASPQILIFLPSFSAGVGVVARQLSSRDADAALRLHVGMNIFALGISGDFDYWPTIGEWTASASVRISI